MSVEIASGDGRLSSKSVTMESPITIIIKTNSKRKNRHPNPATIKSPRKSRSTRKGGSTLANTDRSVPLVCWNAPSVPPPARKRPRKVRGQRIPIPCTDWEMYTPRLLNRSTQFMTATRSLPLNKFCIRPRPSPCARDRLYVKGCTVSTASKPSTIVKKSHTSIQNMAKNYIALNKQAVRVVSVRAPNKNATKADEANTNEQDHSGEMKKRPQPPDNENKSMTSSTPARRSAYNKTAKGSHTAKQHTGAVPGAPNDSIVRTAGPSRAQRPVSHVIQQPLSWCGSKDVLRSVRTPKRAMIQTPSISTTCFHGTDAVLDLKNKAIQFDFPFGVNCTLTIETQPTLIVDGPLLNMQRDPNLSKDATTNIAMKFKPRSNSDGVYACFKNCTDVFGVHHCHTDDVYAYIVGNALCIFMLAHTDDNTVFVKFFFPNPSESMFLGGTIKCMMNDSRKTNTWRAVIRDYPARVDLDACNEYFLKLLNNSKETVLKSQGSRAPSVVKRL